MLEGCTFIGVLAAREMDVPLVAATCSSAPSCAPASTLRFLRYGGSISCGSVGGMSERLLVDITRAQACACQGLLDTDPGLTETRYLFWENGLLRYALNMLQVVSEHLAADRLDNRVVEERVPFKLRLGCF